MQRKNLLKKSKAYYEDNDYYEIFSVAEDGEKKVEKFLKKITKNKVVLDAGCGTGKFIPSIEPLSKKYIGIDLSSNQLTKAKQKSQKKESLFITSNLTSIPLKDNSIDIIISSWVLGTIINLKERNKCLEELKRVLRHNGQIILIENDENSEFEEIRGRTKDTRTKDYNEWIKQNGFTIVNKIHTYFLFKTKKEATKCFKIIYGNKISSKIKDKKIFHNIIIFKYHFK